MAKVRTAEDAEKIRSLMIELQVKLDRNKHTEWGQAVLDAPMVRAKIRNICVHNTTEDYPTVKGWFDDLVTYLR